MGEQPLDAWMQLEAAVWTALEGEPGFAELVRPANRWRMSHGKPRPRVTSADLPEARLRFEGGQVDVTYSSTHWQQQEQLVLELASGDRRAGLIHKLRAVAMKAIGKVARQRLGLDFIAEVTVTEVVQQESPQRWQLERGVNGWIALVRITALMQFPHLEAEGTE